MCWKLFKICKSIVAGLFLFAVIIFSSCEKYAFNTAAIIPVDTVVHFKTVISPIFTANCIGCHNGSRSPDLRANNAYSSLTTGGFVNLPASTSVLYVQITTSGSHIPRTTTLQKQLIYSWISQGAKNN